MTSIDVVTKDTSNAACVADVQEIREVREVRHALTNALAELGECVDTWAVANLLRLHGVRGRRWSASRCPIQRLVSDRVMRVTGRDDPVRVGLSLCTVAVDRGDGDLPTFVRCALPRVVTRFVAEFDNGIHRDLVEEVSL